MKSRLADLAPQGERRMGANPHANGGALLRNLRLPDFRDYAVKVTAPGRVKAEATREMGVLLRDVMQLNLSDRNFRVFGPSDNARTSVSNDLIDSLNATRALFISLASATSSV